MTEEKATTKPPFKLETHVVMREINGEAPYGKAYVTFDGPTVHADTQYELEIEFQDREKHPELIAEFERRAREFQFHGLTFKLTLEEVRV